MSGKHSEKAKPGMEANYLKSDRHVRSVALSDLRDSWVLISIALKDQFQIILQ
jgi:hypothetical protein